MKPSGEKRKSRKKAHGHPFFDTSSQQLIAEDSEAPSEAPAAPTKPRRSHDPAAIYCITLILLFMVLAMAVVIVALVLRLSTAGSPGADATSQPTGHHDVPIPSPPGRWTPPLPQSTPDDHRRPQTLEHPTTGVYHPSRVPTVPPATARRSTTTETTESTTELTTLRTARTTTTSTTTTRPTTRRGPPILTTTATPWQPVVTGTIARPSTYCQTEDCSNITRLYTTFIGGTVLPCQNLYSYTCHNHWIQYPDVRDSVLTGIQSAFVNMSASARQHASSQKARALYESCLARFRQKADNVRVIVEFLRGNGLTFEPDTQTDPLGTTLSLLLRYGIPVFFAFGFEEKFLNNDDFVLAIAESEEFVLSWRDNKRPQVRDIKVRITELLQRVESMDSQTLGGTVDRIAASMSKVFSLREEDSSEQRDVQPLRSFLNHTLLERRWTASLAAHSNRLLPGSFLVSFPAFIRSFTRSVFSRMGAGDLNPFVAFQVTQQLVTLADLGLDKQVYDEKCFPTALKLMKHAVVAPYLLSVVNDSRLQGAAVIAAAIKAKVEKNMRQTPWLEEPTRTDLVNKLRAVRFQVGFPKDLGTRGKVEAFYASYPLVKDVFLRAFLNISAAGALGFLSLLTKRPADLLYLDFDSGGVRTFYRANVLFIPAGALLCPQYSYGAPPEMNYGSLGQNIAHDMMRGFDEENRFTDERGGRLRWTHESDRQYVARTACLNLSLEEAPVARRSVKDVYLADVLASRSLFEAFVDARRQSTVAIRELQEFPARQLFFIARCFQFCKSTPYSPPEMWRRPYEPHRCNVPAANSVDFANAFDCGIRDPNNPPRKCEFW